MRELIEARDVLLSGRFEGGLDPELEAALRRQEESVRRRREEFERFMRGMGQQSGSPFGSNMEQAPGGGALGMGGLFDLLSGIFGSGR